MFDLKNHTYQEVVDFLAANYEKREVKPCCNVSDSDGDSVAVASSSDSNGDVLAGVNDSDGDSVAVAGEEEYELFVVTLDDQYFDNGVENIYHHSIGFDKCYYYSLKYQTDFFLNELGVLDCGGYYLAVCVFQNKVNITKDVVFVEEDAPEDRFFKYHMNTLVGSKDEIIPKRKL